MYSLSSKDPLYLTTSVRPYHGSMHTNGAFFFGGDHRPTSGEVKATDRYGFRSLSNRVTISV